MKRVKTEEPGFLVFNPTATCGEETEAWRTRGGAGGRGGGIDPEHREWKSRVTSIF